MVSSGQLKAIGCRLLIFKANKMDFAKFRLPFRDDGVFGLLLLMVLAVPLAFTVHNYENYETLKYGLWLVLAGAALALYFLRNRPDELSGEGRLFKVNKVFFAMLGLFMVFAAASAFFSVDRIYSLFGFYFRFTGSLLFYAVWAVFVLLLLAVLNREKYELLAKVLVFDSLLIAAVGVMQSQGIAFYESLEVRGFIRAPSLLGNPNFSTLFLASVMPYTLAFFAGSKSLQAKIYYAVTGFLSIWCISALSSRGAWLALLVGLVVAVILAAIYRFPKKYALVFLSALALSAAMIWGFLSVTRLEAVRQTLDLSETNVNQRLYVWDIARQGMAGRPWTGVGHGNFQILYQELRGKHLAGEGVFDDAHNLFLQMGSTGGLPFVISFAALLLVAAAFSLKQLGREKDLLALSALSGIAIFAVASSFTPVSIPCFLVLAVMLAGLLLPNAKDRLLKLPRAVKAFGGILGFGLAVVGMLFLAAEFIFYFGARAYIEGDFQKARSLSGAALKLNPSNPLFYIYRAGSGVKLGESSEDVQSYVERMKALHPKEARVYVSASNIYNILAQDTGKKDYLDLAISNMDRALSLDPFFSERYGKMAVFYFQLGDLEKASGYVQANLIMNEKHFPSWILLAKIYQVQDKKQQFLYALERAYKLDPAMPQIRYIWHQAKNSPDIKKVPLEVYVREGKLE